MGADDPVGGDDRPPRRRPGRRKQNGEGNIRRRSDGRFEGRVYVVTTDGREIRKSIYGSTFEDVHQQLTQLKAQAMIGRRVATTSQTVGAYLDYWLTDVARHRVRASTYQSYEWLSRKYLMPLFGRKRLVRLNGADIRKGFQILKGTCQCCAQGKDQARENKAQAERDKRADRAPRKNARPIEGARCCARTPPTCCHAVVSDGTVRGLHRVLRAALQDAVTEEAILAENPAKNLRLNHRYRPRFTTWTAEDAQRFLKVVRDDRLYALYGVALSLGLRRGEALGLPWADVDMEDGYLRVHQSLQRVAGALQIGPVKTDGSVRTVPVPLALLGVLARHRVLQASEREQAGDRWQESGLVFTTRIGTPLEPRNINRHFDHVMATAAVPRIRFHDLRHSCASMLYSQGVSLENIQDVLGHSSPQVTKMIYIDVADKIPRDAVERLGYLFDEGPEQ
jgi:integrase